MCIGCGVDRHQSSSCDQRGPLLHVGPCQSTGQDQVKGKDGKDGVDGVDGQDGTDGTDGVDSDDDSNSDDDDSDEHNCISKSKSKCKKGSH